MKKLDWPHVSRTVAKAIRAARPGKQHKQERQQLYGSLGEQLWGGRVDEAIETSEGLRSTEEIEPLDAAIKYLNNQREWLGDYEQWKQEGYRVGRGLVERQIELVINRRLKKRGMRWKRENADAVVALRVKQLNNDWEDQAEQLAA